jgi:hypothetical protein
VVVYIDKGFAIQFYTELLKTYSLDNSRENIESTNRLFDLFSKFPDLEIYSDVSQVEKPEIKLFSFLLNFNAQIRTKEQFLFDLRRPIQHLHLLAFTTMVHEWSEEFENKGGLYFTLDDYFKKINEILSLEKTIRFKDLQKPFSWKDISSVSLLPADRVLLIDNYVISSDSKINNNLFPIIRILSRIKSSAFKLDLFVDENKLGWSKIDWQKFESKIQDFQDDEEIDFDFKVIRYSSKNGRNRYDFHDRRLFLRYIKIEVGKGFDLLPYNHEVINDKKVIVGTIFTKDTYDDFRSYYLV